jgi:hypothetical protein
MTQHNPSIDDGRVLVVHRFPDGEEPAGLGWLPNGYLLVAGMAKRLTYRVFDGRTAGQTDVKLPAPQQINDMLATSGGTAFVTQVGFDLDAAQPGRRPPWPRRRRGRRDHGGGSQLPASGQYSASLGTAWARRSVYWTGSRSGTISSCEIPKAA